MTSLATGADDARALPDYAPVSRSALGPALNDQGPYVGHEETRRLLLRDNDPARPAPEVTFADRYTLEVGGERVELAWHGPNSPDNMYIHSQATTR